MDLAFEAIDTLNMWPEGGKNYYHRSGWLNLSKRGSALVDRIRHNPTERGHDPTSDISPEEVRTKFGNIFTETDVGST